MLIYIVYLSVFRSPPLTALLVPVKGVSSDVFAVAFEGRIDPPPLSLENREFNSFHFLRRIMSSTLSKCVGCLRLKNLFAMFRPRTETSKKEAQLQVVTHLWGRTDSLQHACLHEPKHISVMMLLHYMHPRKQTNIQIA